eukprot:gene2336-18723_t
MRWGCVRVGARSAPRVLCTPHRPHAVVGRVLVLRDAAGLREDLPQPSPAPRACAAGARRAGEVHLVPAAGGPPAVPPALADLAAVIEPRAEYNPMAPALGADPDAAEGNQQMFAIVRTDDMGIPGDEMAAARFADALRGEAPPHR